MNEEQKRRALILMQMQLQAGATPSPPSGDALARADAANQIAEDRMALSGTNDRMTGAAMQAMRGVPLVGEWVDEAVDLVNPGRGAELNALADAYKRENPGKSTALGLGGGIVGSVPMAVAAGPAIASNAAGTVGARVIQGALAGSAAGAIEGGISGAGAAEPGKRGAGAIEGAIFGAGAGAALGGLAPGVAEGIKKALVGLKGSDTAIISTTFGITRDAAKVIKRALDTGDMGEAEAALMRAGKDAMLADAGQPARELLDAAANAGGRSGKIARDAVDERASVASAQMQGTLDRFLGKPIGKETAKGAIRKGTEKARSEAYNAAYARPIDYSSVQGRMLETLMKRVPQSAIKRANELMSLEGVDSKQIKAMIGDDGVVSFEILPDVRQLDYITRALNDVADQADGQGKLGGTTALGNATKRLSADIRSRLKNAVPEYRTALDVASDAISRTKANDTGYDLLRPSMKREAVREAMRGASKAEREAAKEGLRSYIDDTLANVARTLTDPNVDVREGIKLVRDMSSRANMEKMRTVLGPRAAQALADSLDQQAVAFELRSAIATNSKTAIRQGIQSSVDDMTSPGALEALASGEPLNAGKRFVQIFTGNSEEAKALRQMGIYEEIAAALTQTRGIKAQRALRLVNRAMSGQKVTEDQASFIGRTVAGSGFLVGGQEVTQRLSSQ